MYGNNNLVKTLNLAKDIETAVEERLHPFFGLGATQGRLLLLVRDASGVTPSDIARALHQKTHSVSGLLNRLEDSSPSYINRERDRSDRRVIHVYLTARAKQLLPKIEAAFIEVGALLDAGQLR